MRNPPPADWEEWERLLDEELRQLPERPAPDSLIPRVMKAVEAKAAKPWWQKAWWLWPPRVQVLSILLVTSVLGAAIHFIPDLPTLATSSPAARRFADLLEYLKPVAEVLAAILNAFVLLLKQVGKWTLVALVGLAVAMYLSCIGLGTVIYRAAFKRG
jgi:hypothetical protein